MCGAVDDLQAEALFAELAILADTANLARLRQVLAELTGATGCRCAPNWSSFDTPAEASPETGCAATGHGVSA